MDQTCMHDWHHLDGECSGQDQVKGLLDGAPGASATGRVERKRDRFRPMASCVSALSGIVANSPRVLPTFPPPPLFIPYGGFSRILCGAPHNMRYVAKLVMWREVRAGRLGGPLAFFGAT